MSDIDKAKKTGEKYAEDQITSDYFQDWVHKQMLEASTSAVDIAAGLEIYALAKEKRAADRLAKNMLQQLRWDTERGLGDREITDLLRAAGISNPRDKARELGPVFWSAMRQKLDSSDVRSWLAEEVIMPAAKQLLRQSRAPKLTEAQRVLLEDLNRTPAATRVWTSEMVAAEELCALGLVTIHGKWVKPTAAGRAALKGGES